MPEVGPSLPLNALPGDGGRRHLRRQRRRETNPHRPRPARTTTSPISITTVQIPSPPPPDCGSPDSGCAATGVGDGLDSALGVGSGVWAGPTGLGDADGELEGADGAKVGVGVGV